MSIIDKALSLLLPHECLVCSIEGSLLCGNCVGLLPLAPASCYRCHTADIGSNMCPDCQRHSPLAAVYAATSYEGAAKDLLWGLKSGGMQSACQPMAELMQVYVSKTALLIPVPTATSRARQRGYDQAELLARELSRLSRQPSMNLLSRIGQSHQVGASKTARLTQLEHAFYVRKPKLVLGQHIILIDDVMTTGATLEQAATSLLQAGAKKVGALVFARA